MTARNQPLCGHQCVCPEWTDITKPCDANSGGVFVCSHDTRRSDATKAEPHDRLKCPKCNGPVFIANIDDVDTILCYDDTCKWKQKIVAEPAEQRIADVIRPHVLYFALCMEQKLRIHDEDRGERGWVGYTNEDEVDYLLRRVFEEARELRKQVKSNPLSAGFSESHDVGNFAMMLDTAHYTDSDLAPMIKELLALLRGKEE